MLVHSEKALRTHTKIKGDLKSTTCSGGKGRGGCEKPGCGGQEACSTGYVLAVRGG